MRASSPATARAIGPADAESLSRANVEGWGRVVGLPSTFPLAHLPLATASARVHQRVLDYGCGAGRLLNHLGRLGFRHVEGCDAAPTACAAAAAHGFRVFCCGDPLRPQLPNQAYDLIYAVGVLSSVIGRSNRLLLLRTLRRAVAPRGSLVIADFRATPAYQDRYAASPAPEVSCVTTVEGLLIHHFSHGELSDVMHDAGFSVASARTVPATSLHGNHLPGEICVAEVPDA